MLVLGRKAEEGIVIIFEDKMLKIKILNIDKNSVKIGFEGPKDIKIYRQELYEEIMKENLQAVNVENVEKAVKLLSNYKHGISK